MVSPASVVSIRADGPSMTGEDSRIDWIVQELTEKPLTKQERIALLRELVRAEKDAPDQLLESALTKLLERLAD